jgi:hypothetical protein
VDHIALLLIRLSVLLWPALLGSSAALGQGTDGDQRGMVLRNVTIISPERIDPLRGAWVAVRDGRIAAVGEGDPDLDQSWSAAQVLDADGRYLTPGLIDSHVHLAAVVGLPFPPPSDLAALVEAYEAQLPRSYLYFGFTTVVDLAVVDRSFLDRFQRAPLHPDVYDCGAALVLANGYPMAYLSPEARFLVNPNFLYDARQADVIPNAFSPANHTPAATVARVTEAGGICVKTFWETGFGELRGLPTPTHDMIAEVIEASHADNLTVTMHANSYEAHRFATETRVDAVVHGLWNWGAFAADTGLPGPIAAVLDTVVAEDIGYMPTMQVLEGMRLMYDPEFLDDPALAAVIPAELIDWYRSDEGRWFAEKLRADFGGADDERIQAIYERGGGGRAASQMTVKYLAERDARFLFGTDTPSGPTYGNPPGYNGAMEMKLLVEAGVSLRQLLIAATIANAEAFHLDDRYGTIQAGKIANLLLLDQNPLESVDAWNTIRAVVLHGEWIDRASLSAAP